MSFLKKKRSRGQLYICQRKRYYISVSYIVDNAFFSNMFMYMRISAFRLYLLRSMLKRVQK
jgi:hypothetical protein